MRITMNQAEIESAIRASIEAQGLSLADKTVMIDLQATRGPEGYTAVIDINKAGEVSEAPAQGKRSIGIEKAVTAAKTEAPANDPAPEAVEAEDDKPPFETEDTEEGDAAEEAPEPSARKSLFGDAKRPVNA